MGAAIGVGGRSGFADMLSRNWRGGGRRGWGCGADIVPMFIDRPYFQTKQCTGICIFVRHVDCFASIAFYAYISASIAFYAHFTLELHDITCLEVFLSDSLCAGIRFWKMYLHTCVLFPTDLRPNIHEPES